MNTYAAYHVMSGSVDPYGLQDHSKTNRTRNYPGERKFDEYTHTTDNGQVIKVYYISEYYRVYGEPRQVQTNPGGKRSRTRTVRSVSSGWAPVFIVMHSYCPGHNPEREARIDNYGNSLEEGVRQDNGRRVMNQVVTGLTIALHTVPGGASADYVSQGEYGEAAKAGAVDAGLSLTGLGIFKALKVAGAAKGSKAIPEYVYRGGGKNPGSLKPRPVDEGMLSVRDSLSNPWPLKPGQQPPLPLGKPIQKIDTSKLPPGTVIPDNVPPGHVSIGPDVDPQVVKDAIVETIKVIKD